MREANVKSGFIKPSDEDEFARISLSGTLVAASGVGQGLATKSSDSTQVNPFLPTDAKPSLITVS